jgi:DNA-binding beta-propeller fold protein YncE
MTIGSYFTFPDGPGSQHPFHVHHHGSTSLAFVETHGITGAAAPVYKVDTNTNTFGASVMPTSEPSGLASSPDGSKLYITTYGNVATPSGIDIVRVSDMTLISSIPLQYSPAGTPENVSPGNLVLSPDGTRAYVVGQADDALHVVNLVTGVEEDSHSLGSGTYSGSGDGSDQIAMSPDGTKVFITQHMSFDPYFVSRVQVISTNDIHHPHTLNALASGGDFNQPVGVTLSPDGTRLFVSSSAADEVLIFNARTEAYIGKVAVPDPTWLAVSPDGSTFVVSSGMQSVAVFSVSTRTLLQTLDLYLSSGPQELSFTPDGAKLFVALRDVAQIAVFTIDPPLAPRSSLSNTGQNLAPIGIAAGILILLGAGTLIALLSSKRKRSQNNIAGRPVHQMPSAD